MLVSSTGRTGFSRAARGVGCRNFLLDLLWRHLRAFDCGHAILGFLQLGERSAPDRVAHHSLNGRRGKQSCALGFLSQLVW